MPVTQLQPTATPGKIRVFVAKAEGVSVLARDHGVSDPTNNYAEVYSNTNYVKNAVPINYGEVPLAR